MSGGFLYLIFFQNDATQSNNHDVTLRDAHHTPRHAPSPDMLGAAHVFSGHGQGGSALAALHLEPCMKVQRQVLEGCPLSATGDQALVPLTPTFKADVHLNLQEWPNGSSV
ncbi:hypothetical protein HYQ46_012860 [Verticillium longisporum]|nr:hypothetical protein HYQ46_012860 [Verticillium longisporum]